MFFTAAESLVPEDTDNAFDVYSRDSGGTPQLLSDGTAITDLDADAGFGGVSADGARVFFATDERLLGADTDKTRDVYSRDSSGTLRLLSDGVRLRFRRLSLLRA